MYLLSSKTRCLSQKSPAQPDSFVEIEKEWIKYSFKQNDLDWPPYITVSIFASRKELGSFITATGNFDSIEELPSGIIFSHGFCFKKRIFVILTTGEVIPKIDMNNAIFKDVN